MSIRREMLQVARLAPKLLGESSELVRAFLLRQQRDDGGFQDRAGQSDLYYTVFGLEGLLALVVQTDPSLDEVWRKAVAYLERFGDGAGLDFVHLCCLARAWATMGNSAAQPESCARWRLRSRMELLGRLESFRARDGGYHLIRGCEGGTAYAAFLACAAYQDCGEPLPDPLRLARSLGRLETPDGAWCNELSPVMLRKPDGATNATAAVVTVLRHLGQSISSSVGEWLVKCVHPQGGFLASPHAPLPDLLSTATALHVLATIQVPLDGLRESCLDFADSLWTNEGGFYGHWQDEAIDCEYTYYGLLALGHLSV